MGFFDDVANKALPEGSSPEADKTVVLTILCKLAEWSRKAQG
jgi:hypothetical protein